MPKSGPQAPRKARNRKTPVELIPRRVTAPTRDDSLEIITRSVFQAGLSWAIIANRWLAFRQAFSGFAVTEVAAYDAFDVDRLMNTDGVIHSLKKIHGTIHNARALLAIESDFGTISAYAATFPTYASLRADVHDRFAFVGDLGCYYWMFRTGHRVPLFEHWIAAQSADHPRMREMVLLGRADGTSSEAADFTI